MLQDQKQHWNNLHHVGKADHYVALGEPTAFASEVNDVIPSGSKILELGCGAANDSFFFASKGHTVSATDFSDVAIAKNNDRYQQKNLTFAVLDTSNPLPFADDAFDVIYARLSLHYFTDNVTRNIFQEIHRILKPGGYLCFLCKSTKDPLYGKGEEIEKDLFEYNGHIRHFFSEAYARECLSKGFEIQKVESGEEQFYRKPSAFIKVIGRKSK